MTTHKYYDMIQGFAYDFKLALKGYNALSELEKQIKAGDPKLLHDISLLQELSYLLRHEKAEIHLVREGDYND